MDLSEESDSGNADNSKHSSSQNRRKDDYRKDRNSPSRSRRESEHIKRDEKDRDRDARERSRNSKRDKDRSYERRRDYRDDRGRSDRRREERSHYRDRDRDRERDRDHRNRKEKSHNRDRSNSREKRRDSCSPREKKDRRRYNSRSTSRERERERNVPNKSSTTVDNNTSVNKAREYERILSKDPTLLNVNTSREINNKLPTPEPKSEATVTLPSYYNPNVINPNKYAEQVQKRKLLWGNKKSEDTASKWGSAKFAQDTDGKVASKFMRLMGIKDVPKSDEAVTTVNSSNSGGSGVDGGVGGSNSSESIKKREEMFSSMEQQYEVARQATHTMRGVGLGFSSQTRQF